MWREIAFYSTRPIHGTYDPAFVTLFAELGERVSDAGLIQGLPPGGTFELRAINGREYWYHRAYNRVTGKDTVREVEW